MTLLDYLRGFVVVSGALLLVGALAVGVVLFVAWAKYRLRPERRPKVH